MNRLAAARLMAVSGIDVIISSAVVAAIGDDMRQERGIVPATRFSAIPSGSAV